MSAAVYSNYRNTKQMIAIDLQLPMPAQSESHRDYSPKFDTYDETRTMPCYGHRLEAFSRHPSQHCSGTGMRLDGGIGNSG